MFVTMESTNLGKRIRVALCEKSDRATMLVMHIVGTVKVYAL